MRRLAVIYASAAALLTVTLPMSVVRSQSAPKTCSDAYSACAAETRLPKDCATEKQWCLKTGTFAHPKTKAVTMGLHKR
ncbi:MAG: hypothetical protein HC868_11905 [Sphingomonadales bacterium]|nr:hypothetical protein [Sphingomonadales bacterium]